MTTNRILLIADASELNRATFAEIFARDYEIMEVAEITELFHAIHKHIENIAAVILGGMPAVEQSVECLQQMSQQGWTESMPFLLSAQQNVDYLVNSALSAGAADVISRPFKPAIVRRRVSNCIDLFQRRLHPDQSSDLFLQQIDQLKSNQSLVIDVLSTTIEFRDYDPGRHIQRMSLIVRMLLEQIMLTCPDYGLTDIEIEQITVASAMHDIGKITLPDSLLMKPGKLTSEEYNLMKQHTIRGDQIIRSLLNGQDNAILNYASDIARHHHEKWDGHGYPDGLYGEENTIWAQVVALADVYDALTGRRVYKAPFSHDEAIQLIQSGECGVFNPLLLDCFQQISNQLKEQLERQAANQENLATRHKVNASQLTDRTLRLLELEREKYRVLSELSSDIIFDYDCISDTIEYSDRYREIFGGETRQVGVHGQLLASRHIQPDDWAILQQKMDALSPEEPFFKMEVRLLTAKNHLEWYEIYVKAFYDPDDMITPLSYLGKMTSIDDLKREMSHWKRQAYTDSLTGLYNRQAVQNMVEPLLYEGNQMGILFIDIDEFKQINDTRGHLFGDKVLKHIGTQIRKKLRATDIVGRIGGDEFLVILRDVPSKELVARKAGELCNIFRSLMPDDGPGYQISGSVGIALFPHDGSEYDILLKKADKALYYAKNHGKDTFAFFEPEMMDESIPSVLSEVDAPTEEENSDSACS